MVTTWVDGMRPIDDFVTGGSGFIGRWLVPELTKDGRRVTILLRGHPGRLTELRGWVDSRGGRGDLVTAVRGDLGAPGLGLSQDDADAVRQSRRVFHLGAAMSFGLPADEAVRINVDASRYVAELASAGPRLERLVVTTGFQHRRSAWWNPGQYHETKLEADRVVRDIADATSLPLTRIHPGAVVGDSRSGETTQFWGWADIVRAIHRRRMPVVPGARGDRLPLVAVDYLAAFMARASLLPSTAGRQFWLLHEATPSLVDVMTIVADELGVRGPRLRVPVPLAAVGLRAGLGRLTGLDAESLTFISGERFAVDETTAVATEVGLVEPDVPELVRRTTRWLADHRGASS